MTALMVILGGAIGAPLRYLIDRVVQSRHASEFPWGTWTVNVVGSFVLGVGIFLLVRRKMLPTGRKS